MDVAPIEALAVPIFTPLSGFASITAPEITVELQDIKEGNWHFKRHSIKSADVSQITLTKGVTFANSDFWRWIIASITGDTEWQLKLPFVPPLRVGGPSPRRQLVLIHFFARNPLGGITAGGITSAQTAIALAAGLAEIGTALSGGVSGSSLEAAAASAGIGAALNFGPPDFTVRVPARAYVLHGCLPTRYKMGGDFDARSGEVSIAELDLKPELVEEISLSS